MTKVSCYRCGYEWITRSKLLRVTCPSCGAKVWLTRDPALKTSRKEVLPANKRLSTRGDSKRG